MKCLSFVPTVVPLQIPEPDSCHEFVESSGGFMLAGANNIVAMVTSAVLMLIPTSGSQATLLRARLINSLAWLLSRLWVCI